MVYCIQYIYRSVIACPRETFASFDFFPLISSLRATEGPGDSSGQLSQRNRWRPLIGKTFSGWRKTVVFEGLKSSPRGDRRWIPMGPFCSMARNPWPDPTRPKPFSPMTVVFYLVTNTVCHTSFPPYDRKRVCEGNAGTPKDEKLVRGRIRSHWTPSRHSHTTRDEKMLT